MLNSTKAMLNQIRYRNGLKTLMIKLLLLVFLLSFLTDVFAQNRRQPLDINIDFESYDPPSTLVVPENIVTRAKFPFIDVHSHQWRMAEGDLTPLINEMDSLNMAIMVNLSGRNSQILKQMTENVQAQHPGRIVVFSNINLQTIDDPTWAEETVKQIIYDVKNGSRGLKIYKSQGMFNTDSSGNRITLDDTRIAPVWEVCGELGIPVLIHAADPRSFWEPHDSTNERWLELKLRPGRKRAADDPAPWDTIIQE